MLHLGQQTHTVFSILGTMTVPSIRVSSDVVAFLVPDTATYWLDNTSAHVLEALNFNVIYL